MTALTQPFFLDCHQVQLSDEQFYQLCISNPDLTIERNAQGVLIFMPPVGGESGRRELLLGGELYLWNKQTQLGQVFSSSTIFRLPNGASRSPDAAWIELSRWQSLTTDQRQKFPPIAPDFVIELRSSTDRLSLLQEKMVEYMANQVKLGWLINPQDQAVEIYRLGDSPEVKALPVTLTGESILPGFELELLSFTDD